MNFKIQSHEFSNHCRSRSAQLGLIAVSFAIICDPLQRSALQPGRTSNEHKNSVLQ